jgi:long-subunit fatty acid transport protein
MGTKGMSKKWLLSLFIFTIPISLLQAQSADDVLRYTLEYPSYDPQSLVMPGVSAATGFGGYQDNPAAMALAERSYFSFDLSTRYVDESGTYLGNESSFSNNETNVGDLGFVYKVPTQRGSLVVGAGYSQSTDFNRAFSANGFNENSTLTDFYASLGRENAINTAAFNAFAIEDVNTDSSVSIFRFGNDFEQFPGMSQDIELTEEGFMGEYSAFLATEVQKNLFIGGSVGYITGEYSLKREFLESDRQGNFDGQFIDADGDGQFETYIDQIMSTDVVDAELEAFSARLGMVYQPIENISIGVNYVFPSVINLEETYNTRIRTTFDDGSQTGLEEAPGEFSYKIKRPSRLKAGITVRSADKLMFSFSAEGVRYSEAEIAYEELEFNEQERSINSVVRSTFNDVINLRGGLEYKINDKFIPRVGYAYYPAPQDGPGSERQFMSGGFTAELTKGLFLDLGLQYSFWEDQNVLYETQNVRSVVQEEVTRLHVMTGIRMTF